MPVDVTNLIGMAQEQGEIMYHSLHLERIELVWKNGDYNYSKTIAFVTGIDLSCNSITMDARRADYPSWTKVPELVQK